MAIIVGPCTEQANLYLAQLKERYDVDVPAIIEQAILRCPYFEGEPSMNWVSMKVMEEMEGTPEAARVTFFHIAVAFLAAHSATWQDLLSAEAVLSSENSPESP